MSNPSGASVTNKKLDVARRFLKLLSSSDESWMEKAYEDSALFHLKSGLNGLLQEVCANYSLQHDLDISRLLEQANQKGISIPVLQELNALSSDPSSWLSQLEKAYVTAYECYSRPQGVVMSNVIVSSSSSENSIAFYLQSISELALRYREESTEY
ncbi:DUF6586 family protein [Marinomonas sp. 2405UD68-3]|uniref:DUF6586 family protein n=1 Tax=Marinomonas sp. 2405UD68-3 TaxID=3391835 RepID=UPI0039C96500